MIDEVVEVVGLSGDTDLPVRVVTADAEAAANSPVPPVRCRHHST
ncbi:hypothetical protein [Streptomyces sp. bgisy031]